MTKPPLPRPCGSCPYRQDVPSGVWAISEYLKLPKYDLETGYQPSQLFDCHQQDGHLCAGWVGCHDMEENLALRVAMFDGSLTPEEVEQVREYETDVPLWASGVEAAHHGLLEIEHPSERVKTIHQNLKRKGITRDH